MKSHALFLMSIALAWSAKAEAREELRLRISLTGFYYQEQELPALSTSALAAQTRIGMGDARIVLDGRELLGRLDARLDVRSRISGSSDTAASGFDFENKFSPQIAAAPTNQVAYRGYLGGPEFIDLREMYLRILLRPRLRLSLGRMFMVEADAQKIDGARLQLELGSSWELGLFVGGAPNPYSRYLLSDYDAPCGNGVAAGDTQLNLQNPIAPANGVTAPAQLAAAGEPCRPSGPQLALTGGLTARYRWRQWWWGTLGLSGAFYGGDGVSAVERDPTVTDRIGNLALANNERDAPRVFLSWTTQASPIKRLQLFADVVFDLAGSSGAQVTRALVSGNLRLFPGDRLHLRATYVYLSSLAIGMYLRNFLYNRNPNGTTLGGLGVVENNLTLLRTGRNEARLSGDLQLLRALHLFAEGRLRHRSLLDGEQNPDVYLDASYQESQRNLAGDVTLGLRDGGTVRGLRSTLSYGFLQGFRSQSHHLRALMGYSVRRTERELATLEAEYAALATADEGADGTSCANLVPLSIQGGDGRAQIDPRLSVFLPDCFGRRRGVTHEAGLTFTLSPTPRMFVLLDYRFTAMLTDPQPELATPTVLGHSLLLRLEGSIDLIRR